MALILVVEDDPHQAGLYACELTSEGFEVMTARDGREAVEAVDQRKPDLVVMDISMPGMDGIECMGRLLAQDNKLPVILNTAYATYRDNFRTWSADAYVVKSSDLDELKGTIRTVLQNRGVV
jgi:DNA-binding response OmpR family regulator